jgi:hypothetical protein
MAERRMFAKTIIDSDAFLEMPLSAQALYFHLGMRADDDGFLNNSGKIKSMVHASDDDLKILVAKRYLIVFEDKVVVIKHWLINNLIRQDRYKATIYSDEKALLTIKANGVYTELGIPDGNQVATRLTQVRLGKDRIGEGREEEREAGASPPPPPVRIGTDGTSRFERAKMAGAACFKPVRKYLLDLGDEDRRQILATLSHYSDDEIAEAIKTYAEMLTDDRYDIFAPYASLIGFLRSGVEKFVDEAKPREVYRKRDPAALEKAERDAVFEQMRKEREETEDDE